MTHWEPVGLGISLRPGDVRPGTAHAKSIALWRDNHGVAHANQTRCPHRGMNLAYGFVRNNNLACPYHGWQYDTDGQCVHIPAHPDLPPARSICVTSYACAEADGVIWVAPDSNADASNDIPSPSAGLSLSGVRTVTIDADAATVRAALDMDAATTWSHQCTDELKLHFVVQALADEITALHLCIEAPVTDIQKRLQASRWAVSRRNAIEASVRGRSINEADI